MGRPVSGERAATTVEAVITAEQLGPWQTVPWDPEARGEEITGRTLRALLLTAKLAASTGWSAATLRARPQWNEPSLSGTLVRVAVRMGLIR